MGSGQGKTRRAQTTSQPTRIVADMDKWQAFVKDQGLINVSLRDYYNIDLHDAQQAQANQSRFGEEIFRDLVALEVLKLPDGLTVEEFTCKVCKRKLNTWSRYDVETLVLIMKHKQTAPPGASSTLLKERNVLGYPDRVLNSTTKMGSSQAYKLVRQFNRALNVIDSVLKA
jgi:hypothetical protein